MECHDDGVGYSDTRSIARAVRLGLSQDIYAPATSRLLWLPVHMAVILTGIWAVPLLLASGVSAYWLMFASLPLGMSFAGLAFVAHETLHGAVTRVRWLRMLVGLLGFAPFWVSPRLWIAWHNQVHHGNTNRPGKDPDMYPTLEEYEDAWAPRAAVDLGAPRSGKWRGAITLLLGFTLQSLQVLVSARRRGYLSRRNYLLAWTETLLCVAGWATLAWLVGLPAFVIVYVVPLSIANSLVMAHIITNHSLSALSDSNDALTTSLTVTVPRWFEFYSLGFGYHVEHHLFPAMSNRYAPRVQRALRAVAPDRYQEMPLFAALLRIWRTPRVYRDAYTLCDPRTGEVALTLGSPLVPAATYFDVSRPIEPSDLRGAPSLLTPAGVDAGHADRTSCMPPPA